MEHSTELNRIRNAYARRARVVRHSPIDDYYYSQVRKAVSEILEPMDGRSVLDIGCADGTWLKVCRELGASKLAGIDLRDECCAVVRRHLPETELVCGSAHRLPWPDSHFDVVSQFVVFTSVLDSELKQRMAAEMLRVVKPSGVILWYDFRVNNPRNRQVRGIGRAEIAALFPFCDIQLRPLILAPPLASRLVPRYPRLASMLEKLPFLRTHYLGLIRRQRCIEEWTHRSDWFVPLSSLT